MMRRKTAERKRLDKQLTRVRHLLRVVDERRAPLAHQLNEARWRIEGQPELVAAFNRFDGLSNRHLRLLRLEGQIVERLAQSKLKGVRRSAITPEMYWEARRKAGGNKTKMADELQVTRQALWEWEKANL